MDPRDVISDPAHSDDEGRDWSDEGGAVGSGPATDPDEDPEAEADPKANPHRDVR